MVSGKSAPKRARLAVPASTTRSSRSSTRASSSERDDGPHEVAVGRLELLGSDCSACGRVGEPPAGGLGVEPRPRIGDELLAVRRRQVAAESMTRCSTRPVLTMSTTISRVGRRSAPARRGAPRSGSATGTA